MNVMSPGSVPEALDLLASDGAAVPIAGGTDLLVHWPVRVEAHERTYVDLSRLDSLRPLRWTADERSEEHTSELQSQSNLVCRLLLEKKKKQSLPDPKSARLNSSHRQVMDGGVVPRISTTRMIVALPGTTHVLCSLALPNLTPVSGLD